MYGLRIVDDNVEQPIRELLNLNLARVNAGLVRDIQLRNAEALLGQRFEDIGVARCSDDVAALLLEFASQRVADTAWRAAGLTVSTLLKRVVMRSSVGLIDLPCDQNVALA